MSQIILEEQVTRNENEVETASAASSIIPSSSQKHVVDWPVASFIIGVHIVALLGIFTFSWKALLVCLFLNWVTGGVGITLGYHRLLTHRSFKVPKWLEYFLAVMGSLACQGGPITWVTAHRIHHAYSDDDKDPHSPVRGFFGPTWVGVL